MGGSLPLADRPITVLVVEDEALNRRLLRRYLTRASMVVLEAEDGRVALDLLRGPAHHVDVVGNRIADTGKVARDLSVSSIEYPTSGAVAITIDAEAPPIA